MDRRVYEYISKQTGDPIIERRTCKRIGEDFAIYQGDKELLEKISPRFNHPNPPYQGGVIKLPFPTLSPLARMRRRMMFRNERGLYSRKSFLSNKKVVSMYHQDTMRNIITPEEIFSNNYNPSDWGINYDPNKFFLSQYQELHKNIPRPGVININNENGDYNTFSSDSKNIYLCADTMRCEDTLYSTTVKYIKDSLDLLNVRNSDYVYECISSHHLAKCIHARYSENCYDCAFIYTCKNCSNCYLCTNLTDKKNYIFNRPAKEGEIEEIKKLMKSYSGMQKILKQVQELLDSEPRPSIWQINNEKSIGSALLNSKNAFWCLDSHDLENCRYCHVNEFNKDAMDCTIFNPNSEQVYEQVCGGNLKKSITGIVGRMSSDIFFSEFVMNSHHALGSINLNNAEYCILNKKYSKQDREKLTFEILDKISKNKDSNDEFKRGEFFPTELSPFPYNDTVAIDYFPINKVIAYNGTETIIDPEGTGIIKVLEDKFIAEASLDLGGEEKIFTKRRTQNYEINIPENAEIIQANDLPDSIDDVDDSILKKVILCEKSGRPFQITALELSFYRKMGIALPRVHYSIRHTRRIKSRPSKEFYLRKCDKTSEKILSLYPPNTPFPVYKQEAFEKEIYG